VRELAFAVRDAQPVSWAAVPQLAFALEITSPRPLRGLTLQCQIQIEPARRGYEPEEQQRLVDLFGEASRWGETLKTMLWTHVPVNAPAFEGTRAVELFVPCSFDFNIAVTKYLHGLQSGEIPLRFLFSGSIFYDDADSRLQIMQLSWSAEAEYRLPVEVWRRMMELHYPGAAWLSLRRDVFERLLQYKSRHGLPTWDQTLELLLG
jgi:hypothetical protein